MALAPSLPLLSVPSSSIILVSIAFCSTGFMPCEKKALVHQEYALKASTCSLGPPAFIVAWEGRLQAPTGLYCISGVCTHACN